MYSFSYAGRLLGIDRKRVSRLVSELGIEVKDHPSNGRAKAIDDKGFARLRIAVRLSFRKRS